MKRVASIATTAVIVAALALAGLVTIVPRAAGAQPLTVLTGSMSPALREGDLIVVRPTPTEHLSVGDVITFQPRSGDPTLVTHRITELATEAGTVVGITTQGDANSAPDRPLIPAQVQGVVWYRVPALGGLATGPARLLLAGLIGLGFVAAAIQTITRPKPETSASAPLTPQ